MQNNTTPKWINFTNGTVRIDNINHIILHKHSWIVGGGCTIELTLKDSAPIKSETLNCEKGEQLFKELLSVIQK